MARGLHECLIFHCAAALAGIKPASLVSCNRSDYPDFALELRELNRRLNPKDIFFAPVCGCKKRVLLLVFARVRSLFSSANLRWRAIFGKRATRFLWVLTR